MHKFRFNHPAEAAVLRERRRVGAAQQKTRMMLLVMIAIKLKIDVKLMIVMLQAQIILICSENSESGDYLFFLFLVHFKVDLYFFQASEGAMSCTYIDLCPLTLDHR